MFAARAARVMPGFAVTEVNMAAVMGIDSRLSDRLGLLTGSGRVCRPTSRRCGAPP